VACGNSSATPTPAPQASRSASPAPTISGPSIGGHVRGAGGSGIAGISVTAWPVAGGSGAGGSSGADGSYLIPNLSAGDYTVQFSDQLNVYAGGSYASSGVTLDGSLAKKVTVATFPVTGIDAILTVGHSLSGSVRQADGSPVAGVGVEVEVCADASSAGSSTCSVSNSVWTGRDGRYSLPDIGDGTYEVAFSDPWPDQAPGQIVPGLVVSGANISNYDLTAPARWSTTGAAIEGVARTAYGDPLPGVQVWVTGPGSTTNMVKTAADGSYFFGLAAGTYTLRFDEPIVAYHGSSGLVRTQADAAPIVLSGTKAIEIDAAISLPASGIWKLLPVRIGNAQLVAFADLTGSDVTAYAATIAADSFTNEILAAMGKTKADILEIASERDHPEIGDIEAATISIDATRYSGASADQIIGAYETVFGQRAAADHSGCSVSRGTLAGKVVLLSVCNGTPSSLYVYAHEDALFEITAKDRATAEAVIAALP
jgi:hypothetical protein